MSLYTYRKFVASERACRRLLHQLRWPRGVRCPGCGGRWIWRMREAGRRDYRCRRCGYHFSDTAGTVFAKTRTPLAKWVLAIGLFRIGTSAQGLTRELAVGYKTAWKMLMALRTAITGDPLLERLVGRVEVDETYFGGRQKGKRGRGAAHKTAVDPSPRVQSPSPVMWSTTGTIATVTIRGSSRLRAFLPASGGSTPGCSTGSSPLTWRFNPSRAACSERRIGPISKPVSATQNTMPSASRA